jgi:polyhydroxybutyrate depolymerase
MEADWRRGLVGGALLACLGSVAHADLLPGDYAFAVQHGGRARTYIVHVPRDRLTSPWPVVINFHGGGSSAAGQQEYSRMDPLSDREGFLAVYPNGTGVFQGRLLTWNAGPCCGYAMQNRIDDVGFVRALLDDLARHTTVDRTRVYATGLSNGAMMAYRLAAEAPDIVAAIAPVAGAALPTPFSPKAPIPILHIHSVDDTRALYAGGLGPPYPLTRARVQHPAVEDVVARWARFGGCADAPEVAPPIRNGAGHTATRIAYENCGAGKEVVLWKLTGAGHVWPGGERSYVELLLGSQAKILGPASDIIDANAAMWAFFSVYRTAVPMVATE